jgi:hypothetical protein
MPDRFGTLRSILQQPPCKETWDTLRAELALWDDEALEHEAVPYALSYLDRWPKDLPRAPDERALLDWERSGRVEPALRVANHVEIPHISALLRLASSPHTARITSASLYCTDLDRHDSALAADALMQLPLRALLIHNHRSWRLRPDPTQLIEALVLPDLHTLSLSLWIEQPAQLVVCIADPDRWPTLRALSWSAERRALTPIKSAALASRPRLTSLVLEGIPCEPGIVAALASGALERLTLTDASLDDDAARTLVHSPGLAQLTHLDLSRNHQLTAATAQAIASSPHMARLTTLNLHQTQLGQGACQALASSPHLAALHTLDISHARVTDGLGALFTSPTLRALRTLNLDGCPIDTADAALIADASWPPDLQSPAWDRAILSEEAAGELARCPHLRSLTQLSPDIARLPPPAADALLASPHLTGLRTLTLDHDADTDARPLRALLDNPALAHVEELHLSGESPSLIPDLHALLDSPQVAHLTTLAIHANVKDDTLRAIARSHLPRLTHLDLLTHPAHSFDAPSTDALRTLLESELAHQLLHLQLGCPLGEEAALLIARAPALANLKHLLLGRTILSPAAMTALLTSPHLQQLDEACLSGDLDAEGMATLAASPLMLRNMHHDTTRGMHNLNERGITADTLPILLDSPHLPRLRWLNLNHNPLGDAGAAILAAHPALATLEQLQLVRTGITLDGFRLLADSPHLRNLWSLTLGMADDALDIQAYAILLDSPHLHPTLRTNLTQRHTERLHRLQLWQQYNSLRRQP